MSLNVDQGLLRPAVCFGLLLRSLLNVAPAVTCAYPKRLTLEYEVAYTSSMHPAVLFYQNAICYSLWTYDTLLRVITGGSRLRATVPRLSLEPGLLGRGDPAVSRD